MRHLIAIAREVIKRHYHLSHIDPLTRLFSTSHEDGVAFNVFCLTLTEEDIAVYTTKLRSHGIHVSQNMRPPVMTFTDDPHSEVLFNLKSCFFPLLNYEQGVYDHPAIRDVLFSYLHASAFTDERDGEQQLSDEDLLNWTRIVTFSVKYFYFLSS